MKIHQKTATEIARMIPGDMLRMTSPRIAADVRRRFQVNSLVAARAVAIARESAQRREGRGHGG